MHGYAFYTKDTISRAASGAIVMYARARRLIWANAFSRLYFRHIVFAPDGDTRMLFPAAITVT